MTRGIGVLFFALSFARLLAGESDADDPDPGKTLPWITSQEKGLASGTFNPWKRGIKLPRFAKILVIPVRDDETTKTGMIDEWQAQFVARRLRAAEREKFDLIVLEIDAHDGDLGACGRIIKDIENCKVPVIALVKNKALGVGSLLAQGCKMILVDPNAEIGSVKVAKNNSVEMSVEQQKKYDAALRAIVKDISEINGYAPALALGMADSGVEVIETTDSRQRFMTGEEFQLASKRGAGLVNTLKRRDQPLWLSAQKAVDLGLAAGVAGNMDELTLGMAAPGAVISRMDISAAETFARFLSNPIWRVLLVIVGLIALFLEMKSPGHGLGYATFAFCIGFFFWLQIFAHNAGLFELLLFGFGAMLVAVELFVLSSFGFLGFAGIFMVLVSIVLAFLPEGSVLGLLGYSGKPNEYMMGQIVEGMEWATLTLLSILGFFAVIWWRGISLPGLSRIALNTVNAGAVYGGDAPLDCAEPVRSGLGLSALAGTVGTAETMLRPAGKIRLDGKTYDAVSEGDFIEPGAPIYVLRAQGSALVVRLSDKKETA